MARRSAPKRAKMAGAIVGLLGLFGVLALVVPGATSSASASTASIDCTIPSGGDYLATVSGDTATVTLNPDCTASPYYLLVYSASNNDVQAVNPLPATCPTYPLTTTAGMIDPTDPNSYCSFPSGDVFPEYAAAGSPVEFSGSTATVTLPNSCWQLDVENYFGAQVSPVTNVAEGLGGNFIWGENGPVGVSCTPVNTPGTAAPLTIGYWKNHTSAMSPLLPQTLGNYEVTTTTEGVAVLSDPSAKYAENQLAAQLLAAELNLANHGPSCPALQSAITDANAVLVAIGYNGPPSSVIGSGSTYRTEAINDATTLVDYNQGTLC